MKTVSPIRSALIASIAFSPALAFGADSESIQDCMDTFAARHFPNSKVSFVVEDDAGFPAPLIASTGTREVQVVASDADSGRVLATATCAVRENSKVGNVIVLLPE